MPADNGRPPRLRTRQAQGKDGPWQTLAKVESLPTAILLGKAVWIERTVSSGTAFTCADAPGLARGCGARLQLRAHRTQ